MPSTPAVERLEPLRALQAQPGRDTGLVAEAREAIRPGPDRVAALRALDGPIQDHRIPGEHASEVVLLRWALRVEASRTRRAPRRTFSTISAESATR